MSSPRITAPFLLLLLATLLSVTGVSSSPAPFFPADQTQTLTKRQAHDAHLASRAGISHGAGDVSKTANVNSNAGAFDGATAEAEGDVNLTYGTVDQILGATILGRNLVYTAPTINAAAEVGAAENMVKPLVSRRQTANVNANAARNVKDISHGARAIFDLPVGSSLPDIPVIPRDTVSLPSVPALPAVPAVPAVPALPPVPRGLLDSLRGQIPGVPSLGLSSLLKGKGKSAAAAAGRQADSMTTEEIEDMIKEDGVAIPGIRSADVPELAFEDEDTDTDTGMDKDTDSDSDSDTDTGKDIDTDTDTGKDTDSDSDSDTDTGKETDSDSDTDTGKDKDTDTDSDSDSDSDSDTGKDSETDSDTDGDMNKDTDSDTDTDTGKDTDIDTDTYMDDLAADIDSAGYDLD